PRADERPKLALGAPGSELREVPLVALRLARRERSPEHADDLAALEQDEVDRKLRDAAGREADHEVAAFPGDRAERGVEQVPAHRVVDHVGSRAARQLANPVLDALALVLDHLVGAVLPADLELLVAAGGGDHARAHDLADLDGG